MAQDLRIAQDSKLQGIRFKVLEFRLMIQGWQFRACLDPQKQAKQGPKTAPQNGLFTQHIPKPQTLKCVIRMQAPALRV